MTAADNYHQNAINNAEIKIAVLEEKVQNMSFQIGRMTKSQEEMAAKLDQVLTALHEARGGWKVMMAAGAGASVLTGFIAWVVAHVKW